MFTWRIGFGILAFIASISEGSNKEAKLKHPDGVRIASAIYFACACWLFFGN